MHAGWRSFFIISYQIFIYKLSCIPSLRTLFVYGIAAGWYKARQILFTVYHHCPHHFKQFCLNSSPYLLQFLIAFLHYLYKYNSMHACITYDMKNVLSRDICKTSLYTYQAMLKVIFVIHHDTYRPK